MHPHSRSFGMIALDVRGSQAYTDGSRPASLYQVSSYGSALPALQSKMIVAMDGNFISKGAPRMGNVKHFQSGTHVNQQVPERLNGSPLPIESFLTYPHTALSPSQDGIEALEL